MKSPNTTPAREHIANAHKADRKGRVLHRKEGIGTYTKALAAGSLAVGLGLGLAGRTIANGITSTLDRAVSAANPSAPPRPKDLITEYAPANPTVDAEQGAYDSMVTGLAMLGEKAHIVRGTIYFDPMSGKQVKQSTEAQGVSDMLTLDVKGVGLVGVYIQNATASGVETTIQGITSTNSFPENSQGVQFVTLNRDLITQAGQELDPVVSQPTGGFLDTTTNKTVVLSAPVSS